MHAGKRDHYSLINGTATPLLSARSVGKVTGGEQGKKACRVEYEHLGKESGEGRNGVLLKEWKGLMNRWRGSY
jgi:hypothetical protein